ncbi:hypothetical protein EWB00_002031, partial [Schistosoma japonicum]
QRQSWTNPLSTFPAKEWPPGGSDPETQERGSEPPNSMHLPLQEESLPAEMFLTHWTQKSWYSQDADRGPKESTMETSFNRDQLEHLTPEISSAKGKEESRKRNLSKAPHSQNS